jgi:predicted outer membrane repeat protein
MRLSLRALRNRTRAPRAPRLGVELLEDRLVPATFNVNSLADVLNPAAGVVTLRSALQAANAGGDASNTINLTLPGTYAITLAGKPGETDNAAGEFAILPTAGNLTVQNTSGGTVVVDGNHLARVFDINANFDPQNPPPKFTVTLQGFTIQNGFVTDAANPDGPNASGGGIRDVGNASLTLTNMVLTNNAATADGGGVVMENTVSTPWTLTVNNTLISNNHAGDAGGGIDADGAGKVFVNAGTVITGNTSVNQGAGIWLDAVLAGTVFQTADLTVTGAVLSGNAALAAANVGGAIGNAGNGVVTITNSTLQNNFSGGVGGGFGDENAQGTLVVRNSLFQGNVAAGNGGAIAAAGPATTITSSEIKGNSSAMNGGGVFASGTTLTVLNSTLAGNAAANGGGIELATTGTGAAGSTITSTTIAGNSALSAEANDNGGGLDVIAPGSLALLNDTITANVASTGGGIFWTGTAGSAVSVQNTILARNVAGTAGPDAFNATGTITDAGGNLIGVSGPGSGNTGFAAGTTRAGNPTSPLDPLLGPLQNNGGPSVGAPGSTLILETAAPLTGSPAIGKAIPVTLTADERGFTLGANTTLDVGAFQTGAVAAASIATLAVNVTTPASGQSFTVTATVAAQTPGPAPAPSVGSVTFSVDGTPAGTVALSGNQAVLTLTAGLPAGRHTVTAAYSGGGLYAGSPAAPLTVVVGTPNERYVGALYQELLHRATDPGAVVWVNLLNQGGSPTVVVQGIENSGENRGLQVQALYQHYLHRQADAGGLSTFVNALAGGSTVEQVAAALVGSAEYFQLHGGTNSGFVSALYQDALNRAPDGGSQAFLQALANGVSRTAVAAMIFASPEFLQDLVQADYTTFLGRSADPTGLAAFVKALQTGTTDQGILAAILGSPEAFARAS